MGAVLFVAALASASAAQAVPGEGSTVLRVLIDAEPGHLNPLLDPDVWGYRLAHDLICEPLVRRVPGSVPPVYEGVLAERFRVDEDGAGVDIALRGGVRFHNGRPLSAHDVRFTLERLYGSARVAPRTQALIADLKRVAVLSAQRLRVELQRPSGQLLASLSEIDILPEHLFRNGSLAYQPHNRRPVCTGPYRLAEWRHGKGELVLQRSPVYWGAAAPMSELRFLVVPDASRALSILRRGGAEVLGDLPALYFPEQVEPAMLRGRLRKMEVPANQVALLLWNGRRPMLSLPSVRRALSLLIDRTRLVREARRGLGDVIALPPPFASSVHPLDLRAAEALLDKAQVVRLSPGGPRALAGSPLRLSLLVPAGASEAVLVAQGVSAAAAAAGLKIDIEVLELAALYGRLRRGAFDAALLAWAWTGDEPDLGPLLRHGGAQAFGGTDSPELDAALDAVRRELNPPRRMEALGRLAALLTEREPVTFLYRPRHLLLLDERLRPERPPLVGDFPVIRNLSLAAR